MSAWLLLAAVVACTFGPWAILDAPTVVRAVRRYRHAAAIRREMEGPAWERMLAGWTAATNAENERRKDGAS